MVIACIAIGDVAHAQRGRGSRRTTPAPTTEAQAPNSPPVEANPYGDDQPPPAPPAPLGTTQTMPSAPPAETRPTPRTATRPAPATTPAPAPTPTPARTAAATPPAAPAPIESADGLDSEANPISSEAAAESVEDEDGRPPRVKFHAAGMSFHATMFSTEAEYGYSLLGPAMTYSYYVGRTWGFAIHGSIYLPLQGRYAGGIIDERHGLVGPYNTRRVGLDGMVLAATRRELTDSLSLIVGAGLHVQSFKLTGTQYIALDGITGGIGLLGRLDYRLSDIVSIGMHVSSGLDPLDFIRHSNRATFTATVTAGLSLGLTFD